MLFLAAEEDHLFPALLTLAIRPNARREGAASYTAMGICLIAPDLDLSEIIDHGELARPSAKASE